MFFNISLFHNRLQIPNIVLCRDFIKHGITVFRIDSSQLLLTVYYYYSLHLTALAARELDEEADAEKYAGLAEEVRNALLDEYRKPAADGRVVIPLIGKGLWDDIWGYIALEKDMNTVSGIVMAHKGETPGLGAEIATPAHQALYKGKTLFEKGDFVSITLRKGGAKDPAHEVDAVTGGTKTSDGVTAMLRDNLSEYLPFFEKARTAASAAGAEESNDQKVESNE